MGPVKISIAGHYKTARSRVLNAALPVKQADNVSEFIVPELGEYDLVVLE